MPNISEAGYQVLPGGSQVYYKDITARSSKVDKQTTVDSFYGTCNTAAATAAKVITVVDTENNFSLRPGVLVTVKFDNVNTANNPTFNVNNTGGFEDYSISIDEPKWSSLPISQIRKLNVSFNPTDAENGKTITWSSNNTNIATINSTTGSITAKSTGTTIITATDGVKNDTYRLIVNGILGDSDNDSEITSYDAYKALLLSVNQGLENQNDENEIVYLDVDRDEVVTSWDAYRILVYSIGVIDEF